MFPERRGRRRAIVGGRRKSGISWPRVAFALTRAASQASSWCMPRGTFFWLEGGRLGRLVPRRAHEPEGGTGVGPPMWRPFFLET